MYKGYQMINKEQRQQVLSKEEQIKKATQNHQEDHFEVIDPAVDEARHRKEED